MALCTKPSGASGSMSITSTGTGVRLIKEKKSALLIKAITFACTVN